MQDELQPSAAERLPSSHASPGRTSASPQTGEQVEGVPAQPHPYSCTQTAEQPSLGSVFPSSQLSGPVVMPSPQSVAHAGPMHSQPGSIVQVVLQPSPASTLPSSQVSPPRRTAS